MAVITTVTEPLVMALRRSGDPSYPVARWWARALVTEDLSGGTCTLSFTPTEATARKYLWSWDWYSHSGGGVAALDWVLIWFAGNASLVYRRIVETMVAQTGAIYVRPDIAPDTLPKAVINPKQYGQTNFEWRAQKNNLNNGDMEWTWSGLLWLPEAINTETGPRFP